MTVQAYAALAAGTTLERWQYDAGDLAPFDAEIRVTHCGVCHSDLHIVKGDWGGTFPMVAGHEVVGEVVAVGNAADTSLIGKRVGVGWQAGACLQCDWCVQGQENLCADSRATCFKGQYGGFADLVRADSRFCHLIPDELSSADAAPLLCAGITVYAPLRRYAQGGHWRVGVVGIGGLGHLGVKFARAMGAEVTAFTTSPSKVEEAKELGAHHVIVTSEDNALRKAKNSLDFLLVTVNASLDWAQYARVLRPNGVLCFVGAAENTVNVPVGILTSKQWVITGGNIGSRTDMREMFRLAVLHNITAKVETLPFEQVNTALSRLEKNDVRYRFVLEWALP
jgi:uncharacterized zinc-type alcohol dehydrogenase-like protein